MDEDGLELTAAFVTLRYSGDNATSCSSTKQCYFGGFLENKEQTSILSHSRNSGTSPSLAAISFMEIKNFTGLSAQSRTTPKNRIITEMTRKLLQVGYSFPQYPTNMQSKCFTR